jgi:hypothetical protein
MSHVSSNITLAQYQLLKEAKIYLSELAGSNVANTMKIIDIHSFDQITEPVIDSILVYRLGIDAHRLHIYQRKTMQVPGRLYGQTLVTEFKKVKIFELIEYTNPISQKITNNKLNLSTEQPEMVFHGSTNIQVPKYLTMAPMTNVLSSLKTSSSCQEISPKLYISGKKSFGNKNRFRFESESSVSIISLETPSRCNSDLESTIISNECKEKIDKIESIDETI